MRLCILDNDILDGYLAETYSSFGAQFIRLFAAEGLHWNIEVFSTRNGQYPDTFDDFDAVLLTGSRADSFSEDPWVVELRRRVGFLLQTRKKMVGVCFGHQLIAHCLGAPVGRAPQGWGAGRMTYTWHDPSLEHAQTLSQVALLASHQDQVFALPAGATLVASSDFCPVAAFTIGNEVFCIQPHPEFEESISAHLLDKRRHLLGETYYHAAHASLQHGHQGAQVMRVIAAFLQGGRPIRTRSH